MYFVWIKYEENFQTDKLAGPERVEAKTKFCFSFNILLFLYFHLTYQPLNKNSENGLKINIGGLANQPWDKQQIFVVL